MRATISSASWVIGLLWMMAGCGSTSTAPDLVTPLDAPDIKETAVDTSAACTPHCRGRNSGYCGIDGCGGTCGCPPNEECIQPWVSDGEYPGCFPTCEYVCAGTWIGSAGPPCGWFERDYPFGFVTCHCGTCDDGNPCTQELCDHEHYEGHTVGHECHAYPEDPGACDPDKLSMIEVPAGTFSMGCNPLAESQCGGDEEPGHDVKLEGYWIDSHEVTVAAYGAYVEAMAESSAYWKSTGLGHAGPWDCGSCEPGAGGLCNWGVPGKEQHPVNCVTWFQADGYCTWAGKRLCTEAEWERAARGTDGRKYPWASGGTGCPASWGGTCQDPEWSTETAKANCLESASPLPQE